MPFQSCFNSVTKGVRNVLIWRDGSEGPGITPTRMTFSCKKRSFRGKFITVKYIAPFECCVCLNGLNQSTFSCNATLFGTLRNGTPSGCKNSFHISPSYTSVNTSGSLSSDRHNSHLCKKSGRSSISCSDSVILL
jgi:hypothetical protein